MHFISAVILCALYFVTVTQSIGLFKVQIKHIVAVFSGYKDCKNEIPMKEVLDMTKMMGVKNMTFEFKKDMNNNQNLQDLLVFLANSEKKTDRWTFRMLTSFEVQLLVSLFEARDRMGNNDGLLEYSEVLQVIDALVLESKVRMLLKAEFQEGDETINAVEFLNGYLAAKRSGKGLDKKQIDELIKIKDHKKVGERLDPVEIKQFFINLSLVKDEYKSHLDFKTTRTVQLVLQELVVNSSEYYYRHINEAGNVSPTPSLEDIFENGPDIGVLGMDSLKLQERLDILAEHNKEADEEAVYTTTSVREVVQTFASLDHDSDGVLTNKELNNIVKILSPKENVMSYIDKFDINGNQKFDIMELFVVAIKFDIILIKRDSYEESDKSDWSDWSDESDEYYWSDEYDWSDESDEYDENGENDNHDENAENDDRVENAENDDRDENDKDSKNNVYKKNVQELCKINEKRV